ncbi:MAG: hypothetical protein PHY64_02225, partial [Eubacteriales bacterium]|nr:hypothetical protein [Eubacteriales bacterium]
MAYHHLIHIFRHYKFAALPPANRAARKTSFPAAVWGGRSAGVETGFHILAQPPPPAKSTGPGLAILLERGNHNNFVPAFRCVGSAGFNNKGDKRMRNKIVIDHPQVQNNTILYSFRVEGEIEEAFNVSEPFSIEYSCDISSVPEGVAIVPLLSNLLPLAWVYDAEIVLPVCDKDFYESIPAFKKGYSDMYPMLDFKGQLTAGQVQDNPPPEANRTGAFFSG